MLYIAICDDEERYLDTEERVLREIMQKNQVTGYEIHRYHSGTELCENPRAEDYQVLFLDISMPGMSGIETAEYIRKKSKDAYIVFATSMVDYAPMGYHVKGFRYILKQNMQTLTEECMETIIRCMRLEEKKITYKFIEGKVELDVNRIIYIENMKHRQTFYVEGEHGQSEYHLNGKLDDIERDLAEDGFLRIHKSILVNVSQIKELKNYRAVLQSGLDLPVPHEKYAEVRNNFYDMREKVR